MDDKITILMATYNGEKFIKEQLDSIIAQTHSNWELFIRDDCSNDNTKLIIRTYIEKYKNIYLLQGKNVGVNKNFEILLKKNYTAKYLMFCDQDDVWVNTKLELQLKYMKSLEELHPQKPLLVYADKIAVDKFLNLIDEKVVVLSDDLWSILVCNPIYGCTMLINSLLLEKILPFPNTIVTYDYWIALVAASIGQISRIPITLVYYRQHEGNVTGGINNYGYFKKLKRWKTVNLSIINEIQQNYCYCKTIPANIIASKYIRIIEANRVVKIIYCAYFRLFSYGVLQTLRYYVILLLFGNNKLNCI